jgi:hypothetical protein
MIKRYDFTYESGETCSYLCKFIKNIHGTILVVTKNRYIAWYLSENGTARGKHVFLQNIRWKPHEYLQETRLALHYAYWIFKEILCKDVAGIIARILWESRWDLCWETESMHFA